MATHFSQGSSGCGYQPRELHLLDIENLLGGSRFLVADVEALKPTYLAISDSTATAQFFVGASANDSCLNGRVGWGQGRATFAPGADGAERSLVATVPMTYAARFDRVVIGSGDGFFTSYAAMLRASGTRVTVVCRERSL